MGTKGAGQKTLNGRQWEQLLNWITPLSASSSRQADIIIHGAVVDFHRQAGPAETILPGICLRIWKNLKHAIGL